MTTIHLRSPDFPVVTFSKIIWENETAKRKRALQSFARSHNIDAFIVGVAVHARIQLFRRPIIYSAASAKL